MLSFTNSPNTIVENSASALAIISNTYIVDVKINNRIFTKASIVIKISLNKYRIIPFNDANLGDLREDFKESIQRKKMIEPTFIEPEQNNTGIVIATINEKTYSGAEIIIDGSKVIVNDKISNFTPTSTSSTHRLLPTLTSPPKTQTTPKNEAPNITTTNITLTEKNNTERDTLVMINGHGIFIDSKKQKAPHRLLPALTSPSKTQITPKNEAPNVTTNIISTQKIRIEYNALVMINKNGTFINSNNSMPINLNEQETSTKGHEEDFHVCRLT